MAGSKPTIRQGTKGDAVVEWQKILGIKADGIFGPLTEGATKTFQRAHGLDPDGVVGALTWGAASAARPPTSHKDYPGAKWKPSPFFSRAIARSPCAIVIHTAECAEVSGADDAVANWFASSEAKVSAHYVVDNDSETQCVREDLIAWHAGPVNDWTIGIELAGRAGQGAAGWADPYSRAVLARAARLVADICRRHRIPVQRPIAGQIPNRARGIYGHADVSAAHGTKGGHWDPGPAFPWGPFIDAVRAEMPKPGDWIRVAAEGEIWEVAPDYVYPVSLAEARDLAAAEGCELPSHELVDAIWRAADLRLAPMPRDHDGTPATMASAEAFTDQASRIVTQIARRKYALLAGTHKDVVVHDGRIGLYGWHRLNGVPIQPFYRGHALSWIDYSQGLRLCRRAAG